jgi:hypothetical protein
VWPGRSLAAALALAVVAGCGGSDAKVYGAFEVRDALREHGFDVDVLSEAERELVRSFPGALPRGAHDVVTGSSVTAVVLGDEEASCGEPDPHMTCLAKENVVLVVRNNRADAAREALEDLD